MRKFLLGICLIGTGYCNNTCDHSPSGVTCNGVNTDNLNVSGVVYLQGTSVSGKANIMGMVDSFSSKLSDVDIRGKAKFVNTDVSSTFKIKGFIDAMNSEFNGPVFIDSNKSMFNNSRINSPIVIVSKNNVAQLILKGNTYVQGNISFSNGNGEVILGPDVKITGKVSGGKVKNIGV